MQYNFSGVVLRNFPFDDFVKDDKDQPMTMKKLAAIAVFQEDRNAPISTEEKINRFRIGQVLLGDNHLLEFTAEEVAVIKKASAHLPPALYGQIIKFFENPVKLIDSGKQADPSPMPVLEQK